MTHNKNCFEDLIKFIEENLSFNDPKALTPHGLDTEGVLLRSFIESHDKYPIEEIKYSFHILDKLQFISIDGEPIGDDVLIKDFTPRGYDYLLNVLYKD